jgi:hypothetical protein
MKRYVEGENRSQSTLFPESLDEYIAEDNPVRVVDVFVDELDLKGLGFEGAEPEATGRPAYHPATLLKIYIYGYLNRIQSSRRLEECGRRAATAPISYARSHIPIMSRFLILNKAATCRYESCSRRMRCNTDILNSAL